MNDPHYSRPVHPKSASQQPFLRRQVSLRTLALVFLFSFLVLLVALLLWFLNATGSFSQPSAVKAANLVYPTLTPFQPYHPTPTPFMPVSHPTLMVDESKPKASYAYLGLDFSPGAERINITIYPTDPSVNSGQPILISFLPGNVCNYGDGHACISAHTNAAGGNIIFLTIHSGVNAEAQAYRHSIEGTGFSKATFSLNQIHANLTNLSGAHVKIQQGLIIIETATMKAASRIPPELVGAYFDAPIMDALTLSAQADARITNLINQTEPMIVFETCGWKHPDEAWAPGTKDTTGSVYLGFIQ